MCFCTECSSVCSYCISSLPEIAKFVNPDDTELFIYKSFSSITKCASVLNVLQSVATAYHHFQK